MSRLSRYRESLDYLYGLQFFGIKLGLDNIRELLLRCGNPQQQLKIVHIAGTNGKGSTAAALAAVFHCAGIPAGLYTSPHLHDFSERIRIDTRPIDQSEIVALIEQLRPCADELQATFFEVATAMALLSFCRHGVEWAILETGMGGRLDATNVVAPELCVLTPIGLDHTAYLGPGYADIAAEKAGIIKTSTPVVSATQQTEAQNVIALTARAHAAPLWFQEKDFRWKENGNGFDFFGSNLQLKRVQPRLQGEHQFNNLALAAAAFDRLMEQGVSADAQAVQQGLERVVWPGRLEWLPRRILVDGAHNPAGAQTLAAYLDDEKISGVHLVFGCKADKQADQVLMNLLPYAARVYVAPPPVDSACQPEGLVALSRAMNVVAEAFDTPEAALSAAEDKRSDREAIVVAGSLFLVAAVRELSLAETDIPTIVV